MIHESPREDSESHPGSRPAQTDEPSNLELPPAGNTPIAILNWRITNLERVPDEDRLRIVTLLESARSAQLLAQPLLSGYKVGVAGSTLDGTMARGCNIEYGAGFGLADATALHAEEAMVAQATMLGLHPTNNPLRYISTTGNGDSPIPACGNCLDILKTFSTPETLFVTEFKDRQAAVITFAEAMPEVFRIVDRNLLSSDEENTLSLAMRTMDRGFDVFTRETPGKSGAAILTEQKKLYAGARRDRADFHSLSALSAAIDHASSAGDPFPRVIAFTSETGYLNGKERQGVFELASAIGKLDTLTVLIHSTRHDITQKATPRELLPFSFGAVELGMEGKVRECIDNLQSSS